MHFGLATHVSIEVDNKSNIIQRLGDDLTAVFKDKNYGPDIKRYVIGIRCVSPKFDKFYSEGIKPKYTKGVKVIKTYGIPFTLEDNLSYTIKIDFDSFKNADEEAGRKILAREILASLVVLEKMKSRIKDFDMISFKADLENYFKREKLIK